MMGPWLCGAGSLLLLAAYAMHDADRQNRHRGRHIGRFRPGGRHR
jgi:hypothetical protein